MNREKFKPIPSFLGYFINKNGEVYSTKRLFNNTGCYRSDAKKLKLNSRRGYLSVSLSKNSKAYRFSVHRLVLMIFCGHNKDKPFVNHKNGIKTDNRVENLEWCTGSENMKHALAT